MAPNSSAIKNLKYCYDKNTLAMGLGPYTASYCSGGAFDGIVLSVLSLAAMFLATLS
jgi:hypothetical protein